MPLLVLVPRDNDDLSGRYKPIAPIQVGLALDPTSFHDRQDEMVVMCGGTFCVALLHACPVAGQTIQSWRRFRQPRRGRVRGVAIEGLRRFPVCQR